MSEMMVRQANPDFEDVKAEFLALAQQNPDLTRQALADPHPWSKAYQIAKNHKTMTELGATDLDTLKAKLRELSEGKTVVTIAGAATVSMQQLADVMDACRQSGVTQIGLATRNAN